MTTTEQKPVAPVEFAGVQSGFGVVPDFELHTVTEDFAGQKKGFTLSLETIHKLGFLTPKESESAKTQLVRQAMKNSANPWSP